jgi:hypothetical protein
MTLATKNGSLIVKDGKIAENCGCCGGWYCCPAEACMNELINSVSVTIGASDYLKQAFQSLGFCSPVRREYSSVGFLGSSLAGTFSLNKQNNGTWSHTFATSAGGTCQASISLSFPSPTSWTLVLSYSVVSFVLTGTDATTPVYKELSEMTCGPSGFFIGPSGDCFSGFPSSRGPIGTVTLSGPFGVSTDGGVKLPCGFASVVSSASQYNNWSNVSLTPGATVTFQPAWPGAGTTVKETGTNSATIAVSFA